MPFAETANRNRVNDGFLVVDQHWRLVYLNTHFEQMFQHAGPDLIGSNLWHLLPDTINTPFYTRCQEAMKMRKSAHLEYYSEDLQVWLDVHAYPYQEGLVVHFQDITDRKQVEERMQFQANALAQVRDAVMAVDMDYRITYWNKGAERLCQHRSEEALGCLAQHIDQFAWFPQLVEQQAAHDLRTTGAWMGESTITVQGQEQPVELSVSVIYDEHETAIGMLAIVRDISQRKQANVERIQLLSREQAARVAAETAHQRLAFLAEASQELTNSLDYRTTLDSLVQLTVPTLADWCIVHIVDEQGQIRTMALAHSDPAREATLREQQSQHPLTWDSAVPVVEVLQTGVARVAPAISQVARTSPDDFSHLSGQIYPLEVTSAMIVPLVARGSTLGAIVLGTSQSGRHYGEDDLALVQDLARRAALAVDNARLYRDAQTMRAESSMLAGRSTFLAEVSRILATSLDYEMTLTDVAFLAVPFLADWFIIDLIREDGRVQRIEARSDTQELAPSSAQSAKWGRIVALAPLVARVMQSGRSEFYPELPEELLSDFRDDDQASHPRAYSAIVVPLLAQRRNLGVIICFSMSEQRRYQLAELTLTEDLAHRISLAIDNALLYQALQEAVRIRDEFLSIASHELKTPLTSLMGYARLLQDLSESSELTERQQRGIRIITEQSERLSKLINALLDISRIRTGRLSIEHGPVDLTSLVQRVVEEIQVVLENHTLNLSVPEQALIVEGDGLRLEQVLQNLIQNAIKYSPEGGFISVELEHLDTRARIKVSDQGIGIPSEALSQMFQPFYRAPNTETQQIVGMGIGLYVVKEIVLLHAGEVDVDSQEGEGSTFLVHLPLAAPQPPVDHYTGVPHRPDLPSPA